MNKELYDAVFGYGDSKIDPFATTEADFDAIVKDNYGISFKELFALEPKTDIEWDIKSGSVIIFLSGEAQFKEDAYMKVFGNALQEFCKKTGFTYVKLGETM